MMSRRIFLHTGAAIAVLSAQSLLIDPAQAQKRGGEIVMAQQAQPPTIDGMTTTAQATRNIALHIWEMIITRDENANVIVDLATAWTISPDGLTYTFTLREARFHNGKMMTSADAKASLERYARGGASPFMRPVKEISTPDARTLVITLNNPVPGFLEQLSSPRAPAVVVPAEEAGKEAGKIENIGTGPFRFVEFRPDSHVNCSAAAHALTLIPAAARSTYELPYKNEIRPISRGRDPATVGIFGLWGLAAAINRYKSGPSTVTRLIARRFVIPQKHSCPPQQLIKS